MAWHVRDPLDLRAMAAAADVLLGTHDFRAFCRRKPGTEPRGAHHPAGDAGPTGASTAGPRWPTPAPATGRLLRFEIEAESFCHQMVRSVVGSLVEVGRGRGNAATLWTGCGRPPGTGPPTRPRPRGSAWSRWTTAEPAPSAPPAGGTPGGLPDPAPGPYPGTSARGTSEDLSPPTGCVAPRIIRQRKTVPLRTFSPKVSEIKRAWHVVDADGLVLGRLATEVARILRGQAPPLFAPHVDTGDHVVVVNADKVVLTSGKADEKFAYRHSGYPGGLRSTSYAELLDEVARRNGPPLRPGHAAQEHPRPGAVGQAQGLRRPRPPPRSPAAPSRSSCPSARRAS